MISFFTTVSSEDVASSHIKILGFFEIIIAIISRCCWPPLSSCGYLFNVVSGSSILTFLRRSIALLVVLMFSELEDLKHSIN